MKQTLILLIGVLILGCKSESNPKKNNLSDVNLIINSETKIDSVWISNINQSESFFLPFSDTIKVDFKSKLDDVYNIEIFTKNGSKSSQLWLDGSNVIISGTLKEKFEIYSILHSDLYYQSVAFSKNYRQLIAKDSDSSTIDAFLLKNIRDNVNSPFSFAVANTFIYRNQNNKRKIKQLFDELSVQSDTLKNHFISIHSKIENILKVNSLNTGDYKFADIENQIATIELDEGKTYLLDFWFINCPPCVRDHKLISNKLDFLKEKNVELIGISTDRNHSDWKNYLEKHHYNWKNYREIDSLKRVTKEMAIWSFPTYLLLKYDGEIIARYNSFEDFEKTFE